MKSKMRYKTKRRINFIYVFLTIDLLIVFALLRTSSAIYVSDAIGEAPLDVALYAFDYDGIYLTTQSGDTLLDISLGDLGPGDTKDYKFTVSNAVRDGNNLVKSDTNTVYDLTVITTTNIRLNFKLYLNQNPDQAGATDLLQNGNLGGAPQLDGWGTYFKHYPLSKRCLKKDAIYTDEYILRVEFPNTYRDYTYQDMVESVKIQLESKQVAPGDSFESLCR